MYRRTEKCRLQHCPISAHRQSRICHWTPPHCPQPLCHMGMFQWRQLFLGALFQHTDRSRPRSSDPCKQPAGMVGTNRNTPSPPKKPQQQTAPNLPEKCFSVLSTTGQLIIIERGKQGYTLAGARCDTAPPREAANALNAAMGVSKAQEAAMLAGSMFGWNRQAADPRNYTKNGKPIVPKQETSKEVR